MIGSNKIATVGFLKKWAAKNPPGNYKVSAHEGRLDFSDSETPEEKSLPSRIEDTGLPDTSSILYLGHLICEDDLLIQLSELGCDKTKSIRMEMKSLEKREKQILVSANVEWAEFEKRMGEYYVGTATVTIGFFFPTYYILVKNVANDVEILIYRPHYLTLKNFSELTYTERSRALLHRDKIASRLIAVREKVLQEKRKRFNWLEKLFLGL